MNDNINRQLRPWLSLFGSLTSVTCATVTANKTSLFDFDRNRRHPFMFSTLYLGVVKHQASFAFVTSFFRLDRVSITTASCTFIGPRSSIIRWSPSQQQSTCAMSRRQTDQIIQTTRPRCSTSPWLRPPQLVLSSSWLWELMQQYLTSCPASACHLHQFHHHLHSALFHDHRLKARCVRWQFLSSYVTGGVVKFSTGQCP